MSKVSTTGGFGSKIGTQNGTLANGNIDTNQRSLVCFKFEPRPFRFNTTPLIIPPKARLESTPACGKAPGKARRHTIQIRRAEGDGTLTVAEVKDALDKVRVEHGQRGVSKDLPLDVSNRWVFPGWVALVPIRKPTRSRAPQSEGPTNNEWHPMSAFLVKREKDTGGRKTVLRC